MTDTANQPPAETPKPATVPRPAERLAKIASTIQFLIAVVLTAGFSAYLFLFPHGIGKHEVEPPRPKPIEIVSIVAPRAITIQTGGEFEKKLEFTLIKEAEITSPLLTVSGTVAASMRPGVKGAPDYWQFNAPEVLTAFTDWQKAGADVIFYESQLVQVRALSKIRLESQQKVVDQLNKLVEAGTETLKSLTVEKTLLAQYEIQGKKEVYEAETQVRVAKRQEAALSRQLQQAGLEPSLLTSSTADMDIIVADVAEAFLNRVKVGLQCKASFVGIPDEEFVGRINSVLPVLSRERRTLRLLLVIDDKHDLLRPGMFGDFGLGTDPRNALLATADAILHIGRADYCLIQPSGTDEKEPWHIVEVEVGEPHAGYVEIIKGVTKGDRVIGKGAILLKPVVVRALQMEASERATPQFSLLELPE